MKHKRNCNKNQGCLCCNIKIYQQTMNECMAYHQTSNFSFQCSFFNMVLSINVSKHQFWHKIIISLNVGRIISLQFYQKRNVS